MCGLFGHISSKDNCQFNWDKFNFLGVDNDERGGDSVGRLVGDQYSTFVSSKVKTSYYDYVIQHRNDAPSHIAIGHTRKASVGAITTTNAQPIRLELEDGYFNMVHNGTIYNYTELAKKYNIEYTNKTDSQVLATIIKDHGFEVLKEYEGAAALIIKDDRIPDTIFVFKGESLSYNKLTEERPLYYFQEDVNSMYISSKEEGLYFIGGDVDSVFSFESNLLYEIKEGVIVNTTKYDRSTCKQNKSYAPVVYGNTYSTGFNSRWNKNDDYNFEDYDDQSSTKTYPQSVPLHCKLWEKDALHSNSVTNILQVSKLRYYCNSKLLTGPVNVNRFGIINYHKKKDDEYTLYFYSGILLKDKESYSAVLKIAGKSKHFKDTYQSLKAIAEYSVYPIGSTSPTFGDILRSSTPPVGYSVYFTGQISPLFSNKTYEVHTGSCSKITPTTIYNQNILSVFPELKQEEVIDDEYIDEREEVLDEVVLKEIRDIHSSLLLAIDAGKTNLNIIGEDSKAITTVDSNLTAIEDVLYDDAKFRTKKLIVKYVE